MRARDLGQGLGGARFGVEGVEEAGTHPGREAGREATRHVGVVDGAIVLGCRGRH